MDNSKKLIAAGVLIKSTKTGKVLLLLRNDEGNEPNTWALVSGGVDLGETILEGLKREVNEEMQIDPNIIQYKYMGEEESVRDNVLFHYYEGLVYEEFQPTLDYENLAWGWFKKDDLPEPLFPGIEDKIKKI